MRCDGGGIGPLAGWLDLVGLGWLDLAGRQEIGNNNNQNNNLLLVPDAGHLLVVGAVSIPGRPPIDRGEAESQLGSFIVN